MKSSLSRRHFLRQTAALGSAAAVAAVLPGRAYAERTAPGEKLNLAIIGVAGRGRSNLKACSGENIVALCDVDERNLGQAATRFPQARKYADFRKLLETEKDLDGVVISTPDHMHAPATLMALHRNLHVYCEKPLTHSVSEAREVTELARRKGVITQMGTQLSTNETMMRAVELIQAGAIGRVREIHIWAGRPLWAQGDPRPKGQDPVPPHLNWDLWVGVAPMRPYVQEYRSGRFHEKPVYHPFHWRGWWDFGTGKFGDMCCHMCHVVFWALELGSPSSAEAESSAPVTDGFPDWEILRFEFPARGKQPPVKMVWYDGEKLPPREVFAEDVSDLVEARLPDGRLPGGHLFIGDEGQLLLSPPLLLPRKKFLDYQPPEPRDWGRVEVRQDWIRGVKSGKQPGCHFGFSGPMTESLLLGNVALRAGKRIEWDPGKFEITNCPEANQYIRREYRKGWELEI